MGSRRMRRRRKDKEQEQEQQQQQEQEQHERKREDPPMADLRVFVVRLGGLVGHRQLRRREETHCLREETSGDSCERHCRSAKERGRDAEWRRVWKAVPKERERCGVERRAEGSALYLHREWPADANLPAAAATITVHLLHQGRETVRAAVQAGSRERTGRR